MFVPEGHDVRFREAAQQTGQVRPRDHGENAARYEEGKPIRIEHAVLELEPANQDFPSVVGVDFSYNWFICVARANQIDVLLVLD